LDVGGIGFGGDGLFFFFSGSGFFVFFVRLALWRAGTETFQYGFCLFFLGLCLFYNFGVVKKKIKIALKIK